jgi:hypothetical protein
MAGGGGDGDGRRGGGGRGGGVVALLNKVWQQVNAAGKAVFLLVTVTGTGRRMCLNGLTVSHTGTGGG